MIQHLSRMIEESESQLPLSVPRPLLLSVYEIAALLGCDPDQILSEALQDWIRNVAPVRLEASLNSQNENSVIKTTPTLPRVDNVKCITDGPSNDELPDLPTSDSLHRAS